MPLAPGSRLGPYEIVSPLGAGGMGEVYRARDTRLDRTVAIKVLPAQLANNAQLRMRFEREARAISSLAHPHICTLHDVGSDDGVDFLVMEHLEGESLADRISRGPMPADEALRCAIQIADALDKAHRHGIIHRDLKPANVMLTKAGAKLLDFGLARSIDTETISANSLTMQAPPTAVKPLTSEGTIVGTFQYMAPEQLDGRPADARTDIFAFGAVLYEMLTGRRAFDGKSRASIIAAIIAAEPPPIATLQPLAPPALERIVSTCLRKEPDERWQSAWDVGLALSAIAAADTESAHPRRRASLAGWIAAAVVATAAAGLALWDRAANHAPPRSLVLEVAPPQGMRFNSTDGPVTISPDGSKIVFGLVTQNGDTLHIRSLDSTEMRPLAGTDTAYDPFWSPDGRELGFFNNGKLKRLNISTGAITTMANVVDGRAGAWGADGVILYTPSANSALYRVPVAGGPPQPATKLDTARQETGHWRPSFLPDGRRFLFVVVSAQPDKSGVFLGSLDSPEKTRVLDIPVPAAYADGRLFYFNRDNVYSVSFDPDEAKTRGEPALVAPNVAFTAQYGVAAFSVSRNGVVAYNSRGEIPATSLAKIDVESGRSEPLPGMGANLDLSKDGTRIAYMSATANNNNDIWTLDLKRTIASRITFGDDNEIGPVWSPDGRTIAYTVATPTGMEVHTRSAGGVNAEKLLDAVELGIEIVDWSPDGKTLLAEMGSLENRTDLVTIDVATRKVTPFAALPFVQASGRFSPDGKWIAYSSDESGGQEIYVQPFPPDGSKWQITNGGGDSPRWTRGGAELFYTAANQPLMSVEVKVVGDSLETGEPKRHGNLGTLDYVVSSDGKTAIGSRRDSPYPAPIVLKMSARPAR